MAAVFQSFVKGLDLTLMQLTKYCNPLNQN